VSLRLRGETLFSDPNTEKLRNRRLISAGPHPHNSDSAKSLKRKCGFT